MHLFTGAKILRYSSHRSLDYPRTVRGKLKPMKTLYIIGIGAGDPDHLTLQAARAMNAVDVLFIPHKGPDKQDLNRLRKQLCERVISHRDYRLVDFAMPVRESEPNTYSRSVAYWHAELEAIYGDLIAEHLNETQAGAFLVWGDPALYDGTIRVLTRLHARNGGFDWQVIPGISSIQALAARHKIPLNDIGENILISPGRKLPESLPDNIDNLVVMLDSRSHLSRLTGQHLHIHWGANIGTHGEELIEGPLDQVWPRIEAARRRIREAQGWVMDTSLIRRSRPDPH